MLSEQHCWNILKSHFDTKGLAHPQIEAFNYFTNTELNTMVSEDPGIQITLQPVESEENPQNLKIFFCDAFVPKPTVIEENRKLHGIYPAQARIRDLTYDSPIYTSVHIQIRDEEGELIESKIHRRIVIGRLPIMLRSQNCYLSQMTLDERRQAGECDYDQGGYFIIKGKERVLTPQLRGIYNIPIVLKQKPNEKYSYIAEIRSMSEETGHSVLLQALLGSDNRTLAFSLPYTQKPIPIGVVFKALGFTTNEEIKDFIGLNLESTERYLRFILRDAHFCDEVSDGYELFHEQTTKSQEDWEELTDEEQTVWQRQMTIKNALAYIGKFTLHTLKEDECLAYAEQVVQTELFPHLGITSSAREKAYLLGSIVNKLLRTALGLRQSDDRDDYINKRVDSSGVLCRDLFRQLFRKFILAILSNLEKKRQVPNIISIISRIPIITNGLRHSFSTGNWGVPKNSYIRTGVSQVLSRLSYGATLSHLRRVAIPIGKESKNAKIRQIHPSQIMYLCPSESPEGAGVGIVLNLSLLTRISRQHSTILIREIVETCTKFILLQNFQGPNILSKVFLNGTLLGMTQTPLQLQEELQRYRSTQALPYDISISYDDIDNEFHIFSDNGRLLRPVFTVKDQELYATQEHGTDWDTLIQSDLIRYIDNREIDKAVVAFDQKELVKYKNDYCEIAPAMMLGVMASIIPFPEHSQCIYYKEPVWMADGTSKCISDVQVGDEVVTFDPIDQRQSITTVSHTYTHDTEKPLYTLTTLNGRQITATFDHRFMTCSGWKRLEDINPEITLVGISTRPKPEPPELNSFTIITSAQWLRLSPYPIETGILNIIPLTSQNKYMLKLARMTGWTHRQGHWTKHKVEIPFPSQQDLEEFKRDVAHLQIHRHCIEDGLSLTYAGSIFVILNYLNQNAGSWVEQSSKAIQTAYYHWDYNIKQRQIFAIHQEYERYTRFYQGSAKLMLSRTEWESLVFIQSDTLFMPIISKTRSSETKISDITTSSTNQSFFCGEGYAVHNSPRNCYQCLDPETPVVMSDGNQKAIKDIIIGDEVITVDPITCVQSTTKVVNQYVRKTNKQIITIETESGRKITCTYDHPVLTTKGWKHAQEAEDICVIPQQVVYTGGDKDVDFVPSITDVDSLGLYTVNGELLPILSRMIGYLLSNGSIDSEELRVQLTFGSLEDCREFRRDVTRLGYTVECSDDVTLFSCNNAFARLLSKAIDNSLSWIKHGSKLVKREFLAGFQGGVAYTTISPTSETEQLISDIHELFQEFDIECTSTHKNFCIKDTYNNQIRYFERIGWRYNRNRYDKHLPLYEYYRVCLRYPNKYTSISDWKYHVEDKAIFVKISGYTERLEGNMIADITTESENHSFIAGDSFCVHNSAMGKQAMSMFALSHLIRTDTSTHVLTYPQKPLVSTKASQMMGFSDMPSGINTVVAIACYQGLTL
jgi:DNA-directed RNA polymerase beta subunit